MKIILKQDVKSIGKKDEIHEVSDATPATSVPAQSGSPRRCRCPEPGPHQE
mgnify:CR=1 FL=1